MTIKAANETLRFQSRKNIGCEADVLEGRERDDHVNAQNFMLCVRGGGSTE